MHYLLCHPPITNSFHWFFSANALSRICFPILRFRKLLPQTPRSKQRPRSCQTLHKPKRCRGRSSPPKNLYQPHHRCACTPHMSPVPQFPPSISSNVPPSSSGTSFNYPAVGIILAIVFLIFVCFGLCCTSYRKAGRYSRQRNVRISQPSRATYANLPSTEDAALGAKDDASPPPPYSPRNKSHTSFIQQQQAQVQSFNSMGNTNLAIQTPAPLSIPQPAYSPRL
jgi:hypothetical protein